MIIQQYPTVPGGIRQGEHKNTFHLGGRKKGRIPIALKFCATKATLLHYFLVWTWDMP